MSQSHELSTPAVDSQQPSRTSQDRPAAEPAGCTADQADDAADIHHDQADGAVATHHGQTDHAAAIHGGQADDATAAHHGQTDDAAAIHRDLAFLAAPALDGRATGSAGDARARSYLAERFRCLGLAPAGDDGGYQQAFTAAGRATANLVGYIRGADSTFGGDIIVIGAHHDHLGSGQLGANDDASGIAALLSIAQAIHRGRAPKRTIAFIAFGGEELGELGSAYFAAHPPGQLPLGRVVYDINLDMIGSYASAGAVYAMGSFRGLPATPLLHALAADRPALHIGLGGRGADSDHEAFCKAGIPYVFFWTPDKHCYHSRCDTLDHLDEPHLVAIAALASSLARQLADTPADLAASRTRLGCTGTTNR